MMAASNMNNLTTLIKRLEAATSRLEDIASSAIAGEGAVANGEADSTARSTPVPGAHQSAGAAPAAASAEPLPASVEDFDTLLKEDVDDFTNKSKALDGPVHEQASAVQRGFAAQRQVILLSTRSKRPDSNNPVYMDIFKDLVHEMQIVNELREANRASPMKDHLSMVGDGMDALSWVTMEGKPANYVEEVFGGAQFYGNRVLKDHKDKEDPHLQYVQAYFKIWKSLIAYIKKHFGMGLTWKQNDGLAPEQALKEIRSGPTTNGAAAAPSPTPAGGAPPPPPPPLPKFDNVPPAPGPPPPPKGGAAGGSNDMGAVFDQINRGESVTSGLRKVDKSEMTHKNPSLRASATVPTRSDSTGSGRGKSPAPPTKAKPEAMRQKKPSKKELDGNKWLIENFENEKQPIEIQAEINHSILITKCKNTTLIVKGKCNAISIDNSPKFSLVVDSLVSSIDVIKCPSFALQVLGSLPTIMLDQVDGGTVYLSAESLHTETYTSKCSSININLPPKQEDGDYTEHPLPEQIRTVVKNGKIESEIVEHAG